MTHNRLHTRDRLRSWGLSIPSVCVLCNDQDESRDHLFFHCRFSSEIWGFFTRASRLSPPSQFVQVLLWLLTATRDRNLSLIIKLIYQASVYFIWRERNLRIHSNIMRPAHLIIKEIQLVIKARLDPLSRLPLGLLCSCLLFLLLCSSFSLACSFWLGLFLTLLVFRWVWALCSFPFWFLFGPACSSGPVCLL